MKIQDVQVSYKRTFNLGEYNSASIEVSLAGAVEEGEDAKLAARFLMEEAKAQLREAAMPLLPFIVMPRPDGDTPEVVRRFAGMDVVED